MANKTKDLIKESKESTTLKTLIFASDINELMVRVINLEDRFDGLNNSGSVVFDVNTFAKEYFLEANAHWINQLNSPKQLEEYMKMMAINITEMNAVGSMTKESMDKSNQTKWKVPSSEEPEALT